MRRFSLLLTPRLMGLMLLALAFTTFAAVFAQVVQPDPLDPSTWFNSQATVFAVALVFSGWAVKLSTALGKDWFQTNGTNTIILSAVLSVAIAGIGGYFALGYLAGSGGLAAALKAAFLALLSWATSNASAKYDRQAAASAAQRAERAKAKLL